ncbi:hypothetical protein [Kribbella endophytica]
MSTQQQPAELAVLMKLRLLALDDNPLRRRVDRLEAGALIAVLASGLLVVPAAAALGTTVRKGADSFALGSAAGFGVLIVAWPLLWGLYRLTRLYLDRRRAQDWTREWEQVAPRWTQSQN